MNPDVQFRFFYNAFRRKDLDFDWMKAKNSKLFEFRIPNRFVFDPVAKFLKQPKLDELLGGVDIFFSPHFLLSPISNDCKKIMTFHDLSFEYFPEFFSWRKRFWHYSLSPLARAKEADKIIAVSESTRNDLIELYNLPPEKVKAIHLGIGEEFKKMDLSDKRFLEIKKKYNLPVRFILYFGTIEPRKNLKGVIYAYDLFRRKYPAKSDYKLVVAGGKGWLYKDILKAAENSAFYPDIVFTGFVEPEDKAYIYNLASLFVFPSFFEGFGFTPLEAMACGVPAIVSHTSSFPETAGEVALMVDPYNLGEIAWAMNEILSDERLAQDLSKKGIECAKKFTWEKCASETMQLIKSLD